MAFLSPTNFLSDLCASAVSYYAIILPVVPVRDIIPQGITSRQGSPWKSARKNVSST